MQSLLQQERLVSIAFHALQARILREALLLQKGACLQHQLPGPDRLIGVGFSVALHHGLDGVGQRAAGPVGVVAWADIRAGLSRLATGDEHSKFVGQGRVVFRGHVLGLTTGLRLIVNLESCHCQLRPHASQVPQNAALFLLCQLPCGPLAGRMAKHSSQAVLHLCGVGDVEPRSLG